MAQLKLKIGCTKEELRQAQRLRYEVFNEEMGAGLPSARATGLDRDEFDDICEHLIIADEDTGAVIGTYRMLSDSVAARHHGFYSAKEFDLQNITSLPGGKLEVGRSCVHKDYRRRQVLTMLWEGVARYAMDCHARYIFGCVSVFTMDPREVSRYFCLLKQMKCFYDIDVQPVNESHRIAVDPSVHFDNPDEVFQTLPVLFRGYVGLGLKVCGMPSVDREFGTTDFFILLDIQHMDARYRKRFFGTYPDGKEKTAAHTR